MTEHPIPEFNKPLTESELVEMIKDLNEKRREFKKTINLPIRQMEEDDTREYRIGSSFKSAYHQAVIESSNQPYNDDLIALLKMATRKPWYYRWFPFLPRFMYNKELRMLNVVCADTTTVTKSLTKTHFIDVLVRARKGKWYHPKYVGFQIWLPW